MILFYFCLSIDRWSISNSTLTYNETIRMEGVNQYQSYTLNTMPFILPMSNTTSKQFLDAAMDINKLQSKLLINIMLVLFFTIGKCQFFQKIY